MMAPEEAPEGAPGDAHTPDDNGGWGSPATGRRRWWAWALGGGVAIGVIVAAVVVLTRPEPEVPGQPAAPAPPADSTIAVTVGDIAVAATDNSWLSGGEPAEPAPAAVEEAVEASRVRLEQYLTAQFATADTRFSTAQFEALLSPRALAALTPQDEEALGAVAVAVEEVDAATVTAQASVTASADAVEVVVLTYDAVVPVTGASGDSGELTHHGEMAFVPDGSRWQVGAVDVTLDVPAAIELEGDDVQPGAAAPEEGQQ